MELGNKLRQLKLMPDGEKYFAVDTDYNLKALIDYAIDTKLSIKEREFINYIQTKPFHTLTVKQGDWLHILVERHFGKLPIEDGMAIDPYTILIQKSLLYEQYGTSDVYVCNDGGVLGEFDKFIGKFQ